MTSNLASVRPASTFCFKCIHVWRAMCASLSAQLSRLRRLLSVVRFRYFFGLMINISQLMTWRTWRAAYQGCLTKQEPHSQG